MSPTLKRGLLPLSPSFFPLFLSSHKIFFPNSIKPHRSLGGMAGGEKYIVHNVLFKFATDNSGFFKGSDMAAAKVIIVIVIFFWIICDILFIYLFIYLFSFFRWEIMN